MSVLSVSTKSQFLSALKTVQAGDTISLASGNYGSIFLDGTRSSNNYLKYSGEVKIVSADVASKAVIEGLYIKGVQNLKFQSINFDYRTETASNTLPFNVASSKNITFRGDVFGGEWDANGYGLGSGLKVNQGENVLVENSTFTGFRKGIEAWGVEGLTIKGNALNGIAYDGIVSGHVHGLAIQNNTITMKSNPAEDDHRDIIQVYNQGAVAPSSDILIENNRLSSSDRVTHGVFMDNGDAKTTGALSEFYSNVTIRDNVITSGQKLGIAVGDTRGLSITGNTLIQSDALNNSPREIAIPVALVAEDSRNVTITGNILHADPIIADASWRRIPGATNDWTVRDNTIVKLTWKIGDPTATASANHQSASGLDDLRFDGTEVASGDRTDQSPDINFDEGDTITFINYQRGTFQGVPQGNPLEVSSSGDYAKIDSITDLRELVGTSSKVTASVSGDTLTILIDQTGGDHGIVFDGLGQEYQSTYDSGLF